MLDILGFRQLVKTQQLVGWCVSSTIYSLLRNPRRQAAAFYWLVVE
jgi:hypothetical protein